VKEEIAAVADTSMNFGPPNGTPSDSGEFSGTGDI
jgi:hypothetical protein